MTPGEPADSQHRPQVSRALFHPYGNPRGTYFHCGSKMRNPRLTIYSHLPKATRITKPGVGDKQDRPVPPPSNQHQMGRPRLPSMEEGLPKVTHEQALVPDPGTSPNHHRHQHGGSTQPRVPSGREGREAASGTPVISHVSSAGLPQHPSFTEETRMKRQVAHPWPTSPAPSPVLALTPSTLPGTQHPKKNGLPPSSTCRVSQCVITNPC